MGRIYVVDAGVLFSDWVLRSNTSKYLTTSSIIDEIKNRPSIQRVESLISTGMITIEDPTKESVDEVQKAAESTGDDSVLSPQDIELIGLAYDRSETTEHIIVVSSDLALLNTAKRLGLSVHDPKGRMTYQIEWLLKCPACGNTSENTSENECVICGTKMKRRAKKRSRI